MKLVRFDAADYLETEEDQIEFVKLLMVGDHVDALVEGLDVIARKRSAAKIVDLAGLDRETLETALQPGSPDRMPILTKVFEAMDLSLPATPLDKTSTAAE